jgi:nickel/cobalt exporter
MSVTIGAGTRATNLLLNLAIGAAVILLFAGLCDAAFAQGSPFGGPRVSTPPAQPADGLVGWILAKQAEFYRSLSGMVRAAKTDGSAVWGLLGLSFLYGVFHAAGPGHGKAVISSYLVANEETWKRGVVLSLASALLQALVAVAIVGIAAVLLRASAASMNNAVRWIEIISYALIALIGARLLWVKSQGLWAAWRALRRPKGEVGAAVTHPHHDRHAHHEHHDHGHDHAHEHRHEHSHQHHGHDHGDASAWGHAHAPEPQQLAGPGGWRRGLTAIVAVGLRPCSGAILVLVFALAQGLFWAGVAATFVMALGTAITVAVIATLTIGAQAWAQRWASARPGGGMVLMRGVEVAAAAVILAFGVLLLSGYMVNERIIGV